jgi:hypothetical protein
MHCIKPRQRFWLLAQSPDNASGIKTFSKQAKTKKQKQKSKNKKPDARNKKYKPRNKTQMLLASGFYSWN